MSDFMASVSDAHKEIAAEIIIMKIWKQLWLIFKFRIIMVENLNILK